MGTKGLRNAAIFTFLFSMAILLVGGHFASLDSHGRSMP